MPSLDDLQREFPTMAFNVYSTPGHVVFEIVDAGGDVTAFEGSTLAACIARAFQPPWAEPEPAPEPPAPAGLFD